MSPPPRNAPLSPLRGKILFYLLLFHDLFLFFQGFTVPAERVLNLQRGRLSIQRAQGRPQPKHKPLDGSPGCVLSEAAQRSHYVHSLAIQAAAKHALNCHRGGFFGAEIAHLFAGKRPSLNADRRRHSRLEPTNCDAASAPLCHPRGGGVPPLSPPRNLPPTSCNLSRSL